MVICIDCGKIIEYRGKRCRSCYDKNRERWTTCKVCLKKFKSCPSQKRKYCSKKCEGLDRLGKKNSFYGKHHTVKTKELISIKNKGKSRNLGIANPLWKEKPGYSSIHAWIRNHKTKTEKCEICGLVLPKELSLIKGKKCKRDITNYQWLCIKCHRKYDSGFKWTESQKQKLRYIAKNRSRDSKGRFIKNV